MIIENNGICPHCGSLLHMEDDICQVCGKEIKPEQREK